MIQKKYNIIYADPPWQYKDTASAGNRGACYKYKVQDMKWLMSLPIQNISDNNCVLFLWVTAPFLQEGLDLIKAWGFEYKTIAFTWVKKNKKADSLFWGMGNYTRSNSEFCLLGLKGKLKRLEKNVHQVIMTPIECHSKKPNEAKNRIERLYGNVPRIELFARERERERVNWDYWGDEIESDIEL